MSDTQSPPIDYVAQRDAMIHGLLDGGAAGDKVKNAIEIFDRLVIDKVQAEIRAELAKIQIQSLQHRVEQAERSELQAREVAENAEQSSITDSLTGAYRKEVGLRKLEDLFVSDETRVAVIVCDMDNFHDFNRRNGLMAGDERLATVSNLWGQVLGLWMESHMRMEHPKLADLEERRHNSSSFDFVLRFGGDEFVIVMVDAPEEVVRNRIAQFRGFVDELMGERVCSVGFAMRGPNDTVSALISRADRQSIIDKQGRVDMRAYPSDGLDIDLLKGGTFS